MGGLFGSKPQAVVPPPIIPPPPMPTPDGDEAKKARRRSLSAQYARQGRQSTVLSDAVTATETLGG